MNMDHRYGRFQTSRYGGSRGLEPTCQAPTACHHGGNKDTDT